MTDTVRVQLLEDGADAERVTELAGHLRRELLELDVRDVTALPSGKAPPGARGLDLALAGGLLVSVGKSVDGLHAVVAAVRKWLSRGGGVRRTVRLEIDGDILELSEATRAEQDKLVDLFVSRHEQVPGT